jgi:hypothetical protein
MKGMVYLKRIIAFFLVILLFITFITTIPGVQAKNYIPPSSKPKTLSEVLFEANSQLGYLYFREKNTKQKLINMNLWNEREIIVYGTPFGDYNANEKQHRFLGETMNGEDFTNVHFPHDAWAGGFLEDRNWIVTPWDNPFIQNNYKISSNDFSENHKYLHQISLGLSMFYKNAYKGKGWVPSLYWSQYVHVLQPPTYWSWGMGRMWHRTASGAVFYATVPIAPHRFTMMNFYVKDLDAGVPAEIINGEVVYIAEEWKTYTATVTLGVKDVLHFYSDEVLVPIAAAVRAQNQAGSSWLQQELKRKSGQGDIKSNTNWFQPTIPTGELSQAAVFNFASTSNPENVATFNWMAVPNITNLVVAINSEYPEDNVPFSVRMYEMETDGRFDDNIIKVPIKVIPASSGPPPAPGPPAPAPTALDLRATVTNNSSPLQQGQSKTITGTLTNTGNVAQATTYVWRVNGSVVETKNITLQPNSTQNVQRNYTAPLNAPLGQMVVVELEINPHRNQPANEPNWVNNKRHTSFSIIHKTESTPDGGLENTIITK